MVFDSMHILVCAVFFAVEVAQGKVVSMCEHDYECLQGYCYESSKTCVPCTDCQTYHRLSLDGVKCAKNPGDCGSCKPGFEQEKLTDDGLRDYCNPIEADNNKGDYTIIAVVCAVLGIILAVIVFIKLGKRICACRGKTESSSIAQVPELNTLRDAERLIVNQTVRVEPGDPPPYTHADQSTSAHFFVSNEADLPVKAMPWCPGNFPSDNVAAAIEAQNNHHSIEHVYCGRCDICSEAMQNLLRESHEDDCVSLASSFFERETCSIVGSSTGELSDDDLAEENAEVNVTSFSRSDSANDSALGTSNTASSSRSNLSRQRFFQHNDIIASKRPRLDSARGSLEVGSGSEENSDPED